MRAARVDNVEGHATVRLVGDAGAAEVPFSLGHLAPGRWRLRLASWLGVEVFASVEVDLSDGLDRSDVVLEVR